MRTICEYELPTKSGEFKLYLPNDYCILDVQIKNNKPVLWVLADYENENKTYSFYFMITGACVTFPVLYIKTIQLPVDFNYCPADGNSTFILHLFTRLNLDV
jgi:hypothetical protein